MNFQIAILSMIIYLIILNRCLTFRLTILNNFIITAILAFYMLLIDPSISALFVLPMFATLLLYIYWLKKEDVLWNIFLILFCYMLAVIVDNVAHFIWKMAGVEPTGHWLSYTIYQMVDYPIFYILCGFILKKIKIHVAMTMLWKEMTSPEGREW